MVFWLLLRFGFQGFEVSFTHLSPDSLTLLLFLIPIFSSLKTSSSSFSLRSSSRNPCFKDCGWNYRNFLVDKQSTRARFYLPLRSILYCCRTTTPPISSDKRSVNTRLLRLVSWIPRTSFCEVMLGWDPHIIDLGVFAWSIGEISNSALLFRCWSTISYTDIFSPPPNYATITPRRHSYNTPCLAHKALTPTFLSLKTSPLLLPAALMNSLLDHQQRAVLPNPHFHLAPLSPPMSPL